MIGCPDISLCREKTVKAKVKRKIFKKKVKIALKKKENRRKNCVKKSKARKCVLHLLEKCNIICPQVQFALQIKTWKIGGTRT